MKNELSKWEWIQKACEMLGYIESAKLADEIEVALKELYGDTKTEDFQNIPEVVWRDMTTLEKYYSIVDLADSARGCIAWESSCRNCGKCLFGEKYGVCKSGTITLYDNFMSCLTEEWSG